MKGEAKLIARVEAAAQTSLRTRGYVCAFDVVTGIGWLRPTIAEEWRRGTTAPLRKLLQVRDEAVATVMAALAQWAKRNDLVAIEAAYAAKTRDARTLRFTSDVDDDIERAWRMHWAPASLGEKKTEKLREKLEKAPDIVVVDAPDMSWTCALCGVSSDDAGSLYLREDAGTICLACADLDHLVFLPSGDAALSRRAKANSALAVVVMRFRRSAKRWERQGILAEEQAIAKAEAQCMSDADARAARAVRDEEKRKKHDVVFADEMTRAIERLFPSCPRDDAIEIAQHASVRGSGRVGRSASGRALADDAVTLAVVASIRHRYTDYDALLMRGVPRDVARDRIRAKVDDVLAAWRAAPSASPDRSARPPQRSASTSER